MPFCSGWGRYRVCWTSPCQQEGAVRAFDQRFTRHSPAAQLSGKRTLLEHPGLNQSGEFQNGYDLPHAARRALLLQGDRFLQHLRWNLLAGQHVRPDGREQCLPPAFTVGFQIPFQGTQTHSLLLTVGDVVGMTGDLPEQRRLFPRLQLPRDDGGDETVPEVGDLLPLLFVHGHLPFSVKWLTQPVSHKVEQNRQGSHFVGRHPRAGSGWQAWKLN